MVEQVVEVVVPAEVVEQVVQEYLVLVVVQAGQAPLI
jgi:hypothetical protein